VQPSGEKRLLSIDVYLDKYPSEQSGLTLDKVIDLARTWSQLHRNRLAADTIRFSIELQPERKRYAIDLICDIEDLKVRVPVTYEDIMAEGEERAIYNAISNGMNQLTSIHEGLMRLR
jgi:hypothetical protein